MIGFPHILTDYDCTVGIRAVAANLLGDQSAWQELVNLNNLIPPYFSLFPGDSLGPVLDATSLTAAASAGATSVSITAPNPQVWIQGNKAFFSTASASGITSEVVIISSYSSGTLILQDSLQNDYQSGATVSVYAPIVQGSQQVLLPGDILYLPVTSGSAVFSQGQFSDVFGSDLLNPVAFSGGDLQAVSGVNTLVQRISAAISTPLGSLPLHPEFGSLVYTAVGAPAQSSVKWRALLRDSLLSLPEVSDVTQVQADIQGDKALVSCLLWVNTSTAPIRIQNESFALPWLQ